MVVKDPGRRNNNYVEVYYVPKYENVPCFGTDCTETTAASLDGCIVNGVYLVIMLFNLIFF